MRFWGSVGAGGCWRSKEVQGQVQLAARGREVGWVDEAARMRTFAKL